jgi:hypothetical protein
MRHLAGVDGLLNDAVLNTCISVELRDFMPMMYYPEKLVTPLPPTLTLAGWGEWGVVAS